MRSIVKFRSYLNVIWGKTNQGKEAFVFVNGFPGTFFLTKRRAIVVSEFSEKRGWLRKKRNHRIIFEAGLHKLKKYHFEFVPKKKAYVGYLKFEAHNDLAEDSMIHFLKAPSKIKEAIEEYLTDLKIKKPLENTGIVLLDTLAPPPQRWLNERFGAD